MKILQIRFQNEKGPNPLPEVKRPKCYVVQLARITRAKKIASTNTCPACILTQLLSECHIVYVFTCLPGGC